MKIYNLSNRAYRYYRNKVKGNSDVSFEEAQRKLSRNIEMSIEAPVGGDRKIYLYGNLHIHVKGDNIIKIVNHWTNNDWFYTNIRKKKELNGLYGISNNENIWDQWNESGSMSHVN